MTVTIRGLVLHEMDWNDTAGRAGRGTVPRTRQVRLSGEESAPPDTTTEVIHRRDEVLALADSDQPLPFVFSTATDMDGWYRFVSTAATLKRHGTTMVVQWQIDAIRLASGVGDGAMESALIGTFRSNSHGLASGDQWHGLPAGAIGVHYGASSPAELARTTVDGDTITVRRGVPADTPARYMLAPGLADQGACRVTIDSLERVGLSAPAPVTSWILENGLVRIQNDASQAFRLAVADAGAWRSDLDWRVRRVSTALGPPDTVQILRNDQQDAAVRLAWSIVGFGRITLDVGLRRGAFHASFGLAANASTTLQLEVHDGSWATGTGFREASANDADGNRWMIGSADTITDSTPTGWRGLAATGRRLTGFVGMILDGSAAVAGNADTDIRDQWLEDRAEVVRTVVP